MYRPPAFREDRPELLHAAIRAHPLATQAGIDILRKGGSAADAAIAINACLGLLNGIVMPYVVKANRKKIEKDIERAAAYLGIKGGFNGFLKWILALRKEIGIPHKLADIGIDTKKLDQVAAMAIKDPSAGGNPIAFSENQYKSLARKCVTGDL